MDVVASVGADEESAAVVEPGEGPLDDPAVTAEAGAVFGLSAGDHGFDAALPDEAAVLVVVVAAIGDQGLRPSARPTDAAADRWDTVEQLEQLGDVVSVGPGERPGQRDPAAVYKEVVLAACSAAIDGAGTRLCAPFFACR